MKLNLRKASALQHEIKEAIKKTKIDLSVNIDKFNKDPFKLFNECKTKLNKSVDKKIGLIKVLYEIRSLVAKQNNESEIGNILTSIEEKKELKQLYQSIIEFPISKSKEYIEGKLESMQKSEDKHYGTEEFNTSVIDEEMKLEHEKIVQKLTKETKDLQDKLLGLNVSLTISLSPESVKILSENGMV